MASATKAQANVTQPTGDKTDVVTEKGEEEGDRASSCYTIDLNGSG